MPELGANLIAGTSMAPVSAFTGPILFSLAALGLYALLTGRTKNDDDDSSPGGGLMQPVA